MAVAMKRSSSFECSNKNPNHTMSTDTKADLALSMLCLIFGNIVKDSTTATLAFIAAAVWTISAVVGAVRDFKSK